MYRHSMTGCAYPTATARPSGRTTSDNASLDGDMKLVVTRPPLPKLGSSMPSAYAPGTAASETANRRYGELRTANSQEPLVRSYIRTNGSAPARVKFSPVGTGPGKGRLPPASHPPR